RFGALLGDAFRALAAYHLIFIAAVAAPLAFDVIGFTLLQRWNRSHGSNAVLNLLADGVFLALYMMFLVALSRAVLVGPGAVKRPFHFALGRREALAFAFALVLIGALSLIVVLSISIMSLFPTAAAFFKQTLSVAGNLPASALFSLACVLLSVRFVFIFPAVACDAETGWRTSWDQTRGNAATLAGIVLLSLMSVTILKFGEARLEAYYSALGPLGPGVVSLLFDVCYYYLEAVAILAVAIAYRQRVGLPADQRSS
ncbi:MAG: hypothetical protein OEO83_14600, partial [Alphaproteobacteria bacterium]|nr:hypothetical protein [Alphaproteobacteria bacterium]